jgi:hypothetical protein
MKVGILTFSSGDNYGAVLQAYALGKFLEDEGHTAEVVDYRPTYLARDFWPVPVPKLHGLSLTARILRLGKWLALLPWSIGLIPWRIARRSAFNKFAKKHLKLSDHRFFPGNSLDRYDALIVGSDQIWNPAITDGGDCVFYGNSPTGPTRRMIAYAASAGAQYSEAARDRRLTTNLHSFAAVSVRETLLANELQSVLGIPIPTVLDPTMLVAPALWRDLAESPSAGFDPYVLLYEVEDVPWARRVAMDLARQTQSRVVSISSGYGYSLPWQKHMRLSPEGFLGRISHANCIVTSSFHGVALALSLAKPFYCVSRSHTPDVRISEILGKLSLEDRFVPADELPAFTPIDYSPDGKPATSLRLLRQRSTDFLHNSLINITSQLQTSG